MGHRVIAPDLPGHGSEMMTPASRPYEKYVPCVRNILDAQTDAVVLVGHGACHEVRGPIDERKGRRRCGESGADLELDRPKQPICLQCDKGGHPAVDPQHWPWTSLPGLYE